MDNGGKKTNSESDISQMLIVNVCIGHRVFGILTTKSLEIIEIIHFWAKRKGEIKLPTSPD